MARAALIALAGATCGCRGGGGRDLDAGAAIHDANGNVSAPVFDADPPADDAIPPTSSDELRKRAIHLLEAIAKDDSRLAADMLFPRDAWVAGRDAADPGKEWTKRVALPFRRAVHALSKHHAAVDPEFVSLEIGRAMQQETPRRHAWKKPLWTVHESRMTYVVAGKTRVLPIREMTAWRGAWYVTRLK